MYLDGPGNVTAGVGHLIANAGVAAGLGFVGGDPAADWQAVKAASPGMKVAAYQSLTTSRLPDASMDALKQSDLGRTQAALLAANPGCAGWPVAVRIACLDMGFNLGVGKFHAQYFGPGCHFGPACGRGDWASAAVESARRGIQQPRNDYIAGLIRSAVGPSAVS
jgi:hypothetical protein